MKNVVELNERTFEQEVMSASSPVLVDFYAPWCGPCKMLAPVFEQLATEYTGKFAKFNVDEAPALANRYSITAVPTVTIFRAGRIIDQHMGFPSRQWFKTRLEKFSDETVAIGQR